jgi:hypothetical protein
MDLNPSGMTGMIMPHLCYEDIVNFGKEFSWSHHNYEQRSYCVSIVGVL